MQKLDPKHASSEDYDIKKAIGRIKTLLSDRRGLSVDLSITDLSGDSIRPVLEALLKQFGTQQLPDSGPDTALPRTILFPYARHSSLPELRHLVQVFKPKDVWPCTVHTDEWYDQGTWLAQPRLVHVHVS